MMVLIIQGKGISLFLFLLPPFSVMIYTSVALMGPLHENNNKNVQECVIEAICNWQN